MPMCEVCAKNPCGCQAWTYTDSTYVRPQCTHIHNILSIYIILYTIYIILDLICRHYSCWTTIHKYTIRHWQCAILVLLQHLHLAYYITQHVRAKPAYEVTKAIVQTCKQIILFTYIYIIYSIQLMLQHVALACQCIKGCNWVLMWRKWQLNSSDHQHLQREERQYPCTSLYMVVSYVDEEKHLNICRLIIQYRFFVSKVIQISMTQIHFLLYFDLLS